MNNFIHFIYDFITIISSNQFLLLTEFIACIVTITIGFLVTKSYTGMGQKKEKSSSAFYFLIFIIISMIIENLTWVLKLSYNLDLISINYTYIQIFVAISWICNMFLYQAFGLFIEHIIDSKLQFRFYHKIFFLWNIILIPIFIHSCYCYIMHIPQYIMLSIIFRTIALYRPILIIPSTIIALNAIYHNKIPSILKKQLCLLLQMIVAPLLIVDLIQCLPIFYTQDPTADISGLITSIVVIFMTAAIIFCSRNLMRFRFFNFSNKVQDKTNTELTGNFKETIEYLSLATTRQELIYITQTFFKENFGISIENTCLNFRYKQEHCTSGIDNHCNISSNTIENFINKENESVELLKKYRILVADEITFDAYYSSNEHDIMLIQFLNNINSEIFLPMYDKNTIIAYLTIKRSEKHKFYSLSEQNKIIIFGTFLASAINIMHNSNTATLLHENKKLKEELHLKHQEVHQYMESIKNLIKQKTKNDVGILFYKDNRFTFGNETAQSLLPINLNHPRKHPSVIAITKLAQQVDSFRTLQTKILYDSNNKQLMITAVPHLDYQGGVILTMHCPDSSDIIKAQIDKLQDPSRIDYLLYLETTKSGKLINKLIPSNNEPFLNFKIKLLQVALHKKATLLQSNKDDLMNLVEIIHNISLRTHLHVIDLQSTLSTHDLSIKLFGLNPLLTLDKEDGLLKKLDQKGTLFIKNIEFLNLETQNKLAEFIRYGIFTMVKSEQRISSDVRIILSVNTDPKSLLEQNKLSVQLFNEITETILQMPSLVTMKDNDLQELIDNVALQSTNNSHFSNLLQISKKEKDELIDYRTASLQEFKIKIQQILVKKSEEYETFHEKHSDPNLIFTDQKLLKAATLGKHALKDAEIMSMLWAEFNCQSKIAQFLGVNRSSVQRRCKEYNLL